VAPVSRGGMCVAAVRVGFSVLVCPADAFLVVCANQIIGLGGVRGEGAFEVMSDGGSVRIKNSLWCGARCFAQVNTKLWLH
jgi:hypothetical protein